MLLEVEGLKCGGCVRAVERQLLTVPGVREASVNLLSRTAWVDLEPGPGSGAEDPLPLLVARLEALGFPARPRPGSGSAVAESRGGPEDNWWVRWRRLVGALVLLLVSGLGHLGEALPVPWQGAWNPLGTAWFHALLASLALLGPGRGILSHGLRTVLAGMPGMDSLVGLGVLSAYLSSLVGWLWPGSGLPCYFNEPVMLLGFVLTGRFLEERARRRTGRAIEALADLQPEEALLHFGDGAARRVRVDQLRPGDRVRLLAGDRVPVDGGVVEGAAAVDTSALTGEAMPVPVAVGCDLAAGALVLDGSLVLEVRRAGAESAIARILQLVERAQVRKAPIQALADRWAGRFALGVLLLAGGTFLFWWLWGAEHWPRVLLLLPPGEDPLPLRGPAHLQLAPQATPLALALQLAVSVLVVACPCALGLATPTAIAVGSGMAARSGLLFRGGDAIETASRLRTVLFDKTGTLTVGRPHVVAVHPAAGSDPGAEERLLALAAALELHSRHPLALALQQEAVRRGVVAPMVSEGRTRPGQGVEGRLASTGTLCRIGRPEWLGSLGVPLSGGGEGGAFRGDVSEATSLVAVAEGSTLLGVLELEDLPRPDAAATLAELRGQGLQLALLSGDRRGSVEALGRRVGLRAAELAWGLGPEQKLERLLSLRREGAVAMVGDGINDAPALAAADLGIAVATGTQIAQEAADLVVMGDRLEGVSRALEIAAGTMGRVRQNLLLAFGYNLIALPLAAGLLLPSFGWLLTPPLAALMMALSSITVVGNALLLQLKFPPRRHRA